jgi:hypothetical protein
MTKKIIILFWLVLTPFFVFAQSGTSQTVEEMLLKLNEDGSHYLNGLS